ncbi:MAG: hypothetical protein KDI36_04545 [Pseudomonadales bacterium]|nr:hypothetical protein [Pseudomonadales bacterium]
MKFRTVSLVPLILIAGCASPGKTVNVSDDHLGVPAAMVAESPSQPTTAADEADTQGTIPAIPRPVGQIELPRPEPLPLESTHTVVVFDVPVSELLFSLARDSDLNLDIDSGITQRVSINAVQQPLRNLLDRIMESTGLRYHLSGNVLRVQEDKPYIKNYVVDYLNIARSSVGRVAVSTQISSTGQGAGGDGETTGDAGNSSDTVVTNVTDHNFWRTLEDNISRILDQGAQGGESDVANPNIIINRESANVSVRATERQHADIGRFISSVQVSTQRQVLIEATIAEVNLSDRYQAGIDWGLINPDATSGVEITQAFNDVSLNSPPTFNLSVSDLSLSGNVLQATLKALETFGEVSVMSSPKIMAMNNQTALLKVVDNLIYFTVDVNIDTGSGLGNGSLTTFETAVNTVPVGFVMSVTPYINNDEGVILNVRPTISRVINFVQDPNPALADANVISEIPVIQVREVESILKVESGNIAVIGGLMQDEITRRERGIPLLKNVPGLGRAFRYDDDEVNKTELVIFLKPTVIQPHQSMGGAGSFLTPTSTRQE